MGGSILVTRAQLRSSGPLDEFIVSPRCKTSEFYELLLSCPASTNFVQRGRVPTYAAACTIARRKLAPSSSRLSSLE